MKTLLALFVAVNMFGNVSPDYISTFYYDPSVTISFSNWKEGTLNVKIISEDKTVIFNDKLNTRKSDGIKYNLRNLTAGKYKVILDNNIKRVVETVILFDGKIVEKDAEVYYKPVIEVNEAKAQINFLSANGQATVTVFGNSGKLYQEKFDNANPLNKVFDFSNLLPGTYSITVNDEYVSRSVNFVR